MTAPMVAGNLAMSGGLTDQQYLDAQDAALKQGNITRENFLKGAGVLYNMTPEGVMWNSDALKDFSGQNTKIDISDYIAAHPNWNTYDVPTSQIAGYAGTLPIGSNVNGTTVNLSITNQATANGEISSDVKASYSSNETNEIIEELTSKN
jgi:hypothetical protein